MPAMVPHTSTYALTNATLTYALEIADHGILEAGLQNAAIRHGLNTYDGHVTSAPVAEAHGLDAPVLPLPRVEHRIDPRERGVTLAGGNADLLAHVRGTGSQYADALGPTQLDAAQQG